LAKRAKKHGRDDEPTDQYQRHKVPRLPFSRSHLDVYWPADLACKTIPDSRILTYGYDTNIRHWLEGPVSRKTVYDHAWDLLNCLEALRRSPFERRRPVLFVAHSLGGIVVQEALRRSQECASTNTHLHSIFESAMGVLFFGTPHRGADPRNFFHHVLTASAQAFGFQVNNQIVNMLMPNAERLTKLRDEFSAMCHRRKWQVYSFQEEYGDLRLFGTKVVNDESSCLNDPAIEIKQHISSNHMDMCRFFGLQDPEYLKVAAAMDFILKKIENSTDMMNPPEIHAEGDHVAGNASPQPPGIPNYSPILQPPISKTGLLNSEITDALGINVSTFPSQDFLLFMEQLPSTAHAYIADIIYSNCQLTCFNFYKYHGLNRTKFCHTDGEYARRLFQISDLRGSFPQNPNQLSLEEWTNKLVHAYGRLNQSDTIHASHLNDPMYSTKVFHLIPKITNLVDAWGNVKAEVAEECLVYSLALCYLLKGWASFDPLKALWAVIHQPELPFINKALLMPPSFSHPPVRDDYVTIAEEDHHSSKKARVEERPDQSGGASEADGTIETDGTIESGGTSEESMPTPDPGGSDALFNHTSS